MLCADRGTVICGSAVRQDGRSASLTAPNGQAQQGLLVAALQDAGTPVDATYRWTGAHGYRSGVTQTRKSSKKAPPSLSLLYKPTVPGLNQERKPR
mgnify:CR=1 FL=1